MKMRFSKKGIVLLFSIMSLMFFLPSIYAAKELTLTLNQSEYYFVVGSEAVIPLEVDNSYDDAIKGMFSYTITQQVNQGGLSYSNSNTQSQSFTMPKNSETINLGFGSSNQPATLKVSLTFTYTDKEEKKVSLNDIMIHFVQDEREKQENNDPVLRYT